MSCIQEVWNQRNPNAVARFTVPGPTVSAAPLSLSISDGRSPGFAGFSQPSPTVSVEDVVAQWGGTDILDLVRQLGGYITTEV